MVEVCTATATHAVRRTHAVLTPSPQPRGSDVSTTTLPPTAPPEQDVLRPRPRGPLRREIVAVIDPPGPQPGPTCHDGAPRTRVRRRGGRRRGSSASSSPARSSPPTADGPARCCGCAARTAPPARSACRRWPTTPSRSSTGSASTPACIDLGVGWARGQPQAGARARPDARPPRAAARVGRAARPAAAPARRPRRERHPSINLWTARPPGPARPPSAAWCCRSSGSSWPYQVGLDISAVLYWVLVGSLGVTAADDLGRVLPRPRAAAAARPSPTGRRRGRRAVIAAYLPNEADTIVETLRGLPAPRSTPAACRSCSPTTPRPDAGRGRARQLWPTTTTT